MSESISIKDLLKQIEDFHNEMDAPYKEYFKQIGADWDTEILVMHISCQQFLPRAPISRFRFSAWIVKDTYYIVKKELLTKIPYDEWDMVPIRY